MTTGAGLPFRAGHIENAESVTESVIREVKEETGLDVSDLKPCGLIDWYNTDKEERWLLFLYRTSSFSGELLDETEEGKVFWADLSDLVHMNLAPNMKEYLKLFFNDDMNEAYATWNERSFSAFNIM